MIAISPAATSAPAGNYLGVPGFRPNTTGFQLYSHNSGSGIGTMLSDGGRMTIQRFKTVDAAAEAIVEFGNFMTQQLSPGELVPPNSIRVRAALVYPFGTPKYVSSSMTYNAGTAYAVGDMCVYGGVYYVSLAGSNNNHTPGAAGNEAWWTAAQIVPLYFGGKRSVDIEPGATVKSDIAGISVAGKANIGIATMVEPLTRAVVAVGSITAASTYAAGTTYAAGDIVVYSSRYYESLQAGNVGNTPAAAGTAYWGPVVYPYGLTAYTAGTNPDWIAVTAAAAGGGRPTDNTTTPPTANTGATAAGYGPICILMRPAQQVGTRPLICGFGDSIFNGASDGLLFINEPGGYFSRAINDATGPLYPHVRVNKSGDALKYWVTPSGTSRYGRSISRAHLSGVTHCICEMGTNDIGSTTLAVMQTEMLAVWNALRLRGILAWQTTITPQTDSTDSWATVANQTARTNFGATSVWSQLNGWITAGAPLDSSSLQPVAVGTAGAIAAGAATHPLKGIIDITSACCDATVPWAWKAGATADGTHPNSATYAALAALVPIATIAAVPAL